MKSFKVVLAGFLCLFFLLPHPASGADSRDPSIAAGQAALKQGMEAAKKKNWPLAVKRYTEAQKRIHLSPQIMHNLALAHAQMGNELLADAWFRAYLGAVPQAANADEVRAEIARLEQATEEKVQTLFKQAEDLAELLPLQAGTIGYGRRADAFNRISWYRDMLGDFTGADEDLRKMKLVAVTKTTEFSKESRKVEFITTLAEIGDIDAALSVLRSMGDTRPPRPPYFTKEEYKSLDPREKAKKKILEGIINSGDMAKATQFAREEGFAMPQTKESNIDVARNHLRKGNIAAAIRSVGSDQSFSALFIKGEVEAAFQKEAGELEIGAFAPGAWVYHYVYIYGEYTKDLLCLGDIQNARKIAALAAGLTARFKYPTTGNTSEFASKEWKEYVNRRVGSYACLDKAYIDVETGKADDAIKHMNEGLRIRYPKIKGTEIEYEEQRAEWQRDLCDFAISRGKPAAAEKIADSFTESRERIDFLRQVLAAYEANADRANAGRLTKKLTGLLADVQAGWDPENLGREIVVNAWMDAAYKLSEKTALSDLPACISEIKKNRSPDEMPWFIAIGAGEIGKGLMKVRFLDRIYR